MVLNYIFPAESTTYSKNLTLTPLTTFSTVSDFGENPLVARFEVAHLRNSPTDVIPPERFARSCGMTLGLNNCEIATAENLEMQGQLDCGRRISNSRVGFGSSPGTYAAKLRARFTASQAGPDWFKAKY